MVVAVTFGRVVGGSGLLTVHPGQASPSGGSGRSKGEIMFVLLLPAAAIALAGYGVVRVVEVVENVVKHR